MIKVFCIILLTIKPFHLIAMHNGLITEEQSSEANSKRRKTNDNAYSTSLATPLTHSHSLTIILSHLLNENGLKQNIDNFRTTCKQNYKLLYDFYPLNQKRAYKIDLKDMAKNTIVKKNFLQFLNFLRFLGSLDNSSVLPNLTVRLINFNNECLESPENFRNAFSKVKSLQLLAQEPILLNNIYIENLFQYSNPLYLEQLTLQNFTIENDEFIDNEGYFDNSSENQILFWDLFENIPITNLEYSITIANILFEVCNSLSRLPFWHYNLQPSAISFLQRLIYLHPALRLVNEKIRKLRLPSQAKPEENSDITIEIFLNYLKNCCNLEILNVTGLIYEMKDAKNSSFIERIAGLKLPKLKTVIVEEEIYEIGHSWFMRKPLLPRENKYKEYQLILQKWREILAPTGIELQTNEETLVLTD